MEKIIVVVEDLKDMRDVIVEEISFIGKKLGESFDIVELQSVCEVRDLLASPIDPFMFICDDVIIGGRLCDEIVSGSLVIDVPFVFMSGSVESDNLERLRKFNSNYLGFIPKPCGEYLEAMLLDYIYEANKRCMVKRAGEFLDAHSMDLSVCGREVFVACFTACGTWVELAVIELSKDIKYSSRLNIKDDIMKLLPDTHELLYKNKRLRLFKK